MTVLQLYQIGDDLTTLNMPLFAALSSNRLIRTACEGLSRGCAPVFVFKARGRNLLKARNYRYMELEMII